jgi:HD-like signal output (HDOD) protein
MDKNTKLELIQRALGLRHKLKVHESMKQPETHEEIAVMMLAKWEYEDELRAIEDLLNESRASNASNKRQQILKDGVKLKKFSASQDSESDNQARASKAKARKK